MQFLARIRKDCPLEKLWKGAKRERGKVFETEFTLKGDSYFSEPLSGHEVMNLKYHPAILLEAVSTLPQVSEN